LSQISNFADEDVRRALRAMSADVQASLAMNRAMLHTLAALSPALASVAERALDEEARLALQGGAPKQVLQRIEDARDGLRGEAAAIHMMSTVELALIAAADALPDIHDLHEA
jgi:hypothetical protein